LRGWGREMGPGAVNWAAGSGSVKKGRKKKGGKENHTGIRGWMLRAKNTTCKKMACASLKERRREKAREGTMATSDWGDRKKGVCPERNEN